MHKRTEPTMANDLINVYAITPFSFTMSPLESVITDLISDYLIRDKMPGCLTPEHK